MRKVILGVLAGLLAWNIWLTIRLFNYTTIGTDNRTVIQNTVNGYETDVTDTVAQAKASLVRVSNEARDNSGVIYAVDKEDVYVITSSLSMQANATVMVQFDNGISVEGTVAGVDTGTGLAVVKTVPGFEVQAIKQGNSSLITAGEPVTAIGGRRKNESAMISTGVVSALSQMKVTLDGNWISSVLETDATVADDNIGGALMNLSGEMLGVIISRPIDGQPEMGYAVSINEVKQVYSEIKTGGSVIRGSLGVIGRSVSTMEAYEKSALNISLDKTKGVCVTSIDVGSAASGLLKDGDLITAVDGKTLTNIEDLHTILYSHAKGDTLALSVTRDGAEQQIAVILK